MNFRSIRFRVTFWVMAILGGIFLVLGTGLYLNRSRQLLSDLDVALKARADWIEGLARKPAQANDFAQFQEEMEEHTDLGREGRVVQILNASGELVFRSQNLQELILPVSEAKLAKLGPCQWGIEPIVFANKGLLRLITQNGKEEEDGSVGFFIQVGMPMDETQKALSRLFWMLCAGIPLAVLLIGALTWLLADRTLKPISAIIQAAKQIKPDDLGERLEVPKTGDEIEQLATALNDMFRRLDGNLQQMRQFIADAAHEIRTPLGILLGETDVALKAPRPGEDYRQALESNREEIVRLSGLVERLLFLSHADAGQWHWDMRPLSLKKLLCELAEKTRLLASDKDLEVVLEANRDIAIEGDEMRLRQLLLNLVDNALKHSRPKGRVVLSLRQEDGHAGIGIRDDGVGIPREHLQLIFDRFYRVDKARERGRGNYGLGLSIAKTIAMAHRGKIEVQSDLGQGSLFTLWLPIKKT